MAITTITAIAVVRELSKGLKKAKTNIATYSWNNGEITARHSTVKNERTGGLYLELRCRKPEYGDIGKLFSVRLSPGWNQKQFETAVNRLVKKEIEERHRRSFAEEAFNYLKSLPKTFSESDLFYEEVEKQSKIIGTPIYDEMTIDQAVAWKNWLIKTYHMSIDQEWIDAEKKRPPRIKGEAKTYVKVLTSFQMIGVLGFHVSEKAWDDEDFVGNVLLWKKPIADYKHQHSISHKMMPLDNLHKN